MTDLFDLYAFRNVVLSTSPEVGTDARIPGRALKKAKRSPLPPNAFLSNNTVLVKCWRGRTTLFGDTIGQLQVNQSGLQLMGWALVTVLTRTFRSRVRPDLYCVYRVLPYLTVLEVCCLPIGGGHLIWRMAARAEWAHNDKVLGGETLQQVSPGFTMAKLDGETFLMR